MAINPCDRSKIDNALHWWPKALPDSPLWRWIPLLLALQAQNPEGWRWKLSNQHDRQSRNLLFEVLGVAESTNTVDCDLLIVNSWKQDNGGQRRSVGTTVQGKHPLTYPGLCMDHKEKVLRGCKNNYSG